MITIENTNKFAKVTADAIAKVELTVKDASTKKRWINAIAKAVVQIEENGAFMTYDEKENHLVIWSQGSDKVYSANGVCQCEAYARGLPCWHRAGARLIRIYLGLDENSRPKFKAAAVEAVYLKNTKEPLRVEHYGSVRLPVYH